MDYSTEVRQRFTAPARVGDIPNGDADICEGSAEDRSLAVWVRFQVQVQAGTVRQARYRAFGCPHTLAAADRVAVLLEGRSLEDLKAIDWPALARDIGMPREKFGKLLRIEDALVACQAQAQRTQVS
jgi:NifU-like protein involved in Fe-S cluster formation